MLPQLGSYLYKIKNVVQKCTFSFFYLLIYKGLQKIKCQSQDILLNIFNTYNFLYMLTLKEYNNLLLI